VADQLLLELAAVLHVCGGAQLQDEVRQGLLGTGTSVVAWWRSGWQSLCVIECLARRQE
jgi:hypothetical protein